MKGDIQQWLTWLRGVSPIYIALIEVGLTLLGVIIASLIVMVMHNIIYNRLQKTSKLWDDTLFSALHAPLQLFIWIGGLILAVMPIQILCPKTKLLPVLTLGLKIVTVIAVVWFLLRYVRLFEMKLMNAEPNPKKKKQMDKATTLMVGKLLRIVVAVVAILLVLQLVGIKVTALVAFGGAGALIIGYAGKDMLANFFGGLMIFTDRQFTVGDWISSPDKNIEGTVEHIGWRITRIRAFDQRPLYVPNATFATISVLNPSRMTHRRIKADIGVRYDDVGRIKGIVDDITAYLKSHPGIDANQTLFVKFVEFAASSLNIQVYTFTKTKMWMEFLDIQEEVFLKVAEIVASHGAELAFPTQTIEIPKGLAVVKQ